MPGTATALSRSAEHYALCSELRILFAFDPWRSAILLVAGDKSGRWRQWYRQAIPRAEQKSRVSQIERGRVSTREVLDRYVGALGGQLSLMADFGDELLRVG